MLSGGLRPKGKEFKEECAKNVATKTRLSKKFEGSEVKIMRGISCIQNRISLW